MYLGADEKLRLFDASAQRFLRGQVRGDQKGHLEQRVHRILKTGRARLAPVASRSPHSEALQAAGRAKA